MATSPQAAAADQSALIIEVPEAEPVVGSFRARFDPSSAVGVPAHVTVIYPFLPPARISASVLQSLRDLFVHLPAFRARFSTIRHFPRTLYLAPVPGPPFRRLTTFVFTQFPAAAPYGGQFSDIVPHLTVARAASSRQLAKIAADFRAAAKGSLPVQTVVAAVTLIERRAGRWRRCYVFQLGPKPIRCASQARSRRGV